MLKLKPLVTKNSPFSVPVKVNNKVTWVRPKLVCEVGYTSITNEGILRHPVYKGLRPEKKSESIRQETESSVPVEKLIATVKTK